MNPLIQLRKATSVFLVALACFALSPQARAVCQDACLTNHNTVQGRDALISLTTGDSNTAIGSRALIVNTTGSANTAIGAFTLVDNTTGFANTAIGNAALIVNTTGAGNTASGVQALLSNTTGENNTATGLSALQSNTTGDNNIGLGESAGLFLTTGSNNIDIGNVGVAAESGRIRIGTQGTQTKTFIAGIFGSPMAGTVVLINSAGKLGVVPSSARFKDAIKPMDKASEMILALKPVTFRYKKDVDPAGIPQFGLIAEQVEKVNRDLVTRDEQGKPFTVRYEAVNAMLLNEFLKEHRKVEEQETTIAQLKKELQATTTRQQKQIEALTATVQKVSAQVEMSRPAPQTVADNH